ncbi:glycoside hydrolase family 26 protein [Kitasatospora sp. NBC_01539]|uniref:glycoside hydrolase family 26 protein n=1 Tax=Kitasatospora sp. NBC_01539 TaxID=2903577 RepID=UPI0038602582
MTRSSRWLRAVVCVLLVAVAPACSSSTVGPRMQVAPTHQADKVAQEAQPPATADIRRSAGQYFGVSTFRTPSAEETAAVAAAAGRKPTMLQYFLDWRKEFDPETVREIYHQGAVPMLTWEPGDAPYDASQPWYAPRRITSGDFDAYITRFARSVRDQRWPVVLRFAHEMNGDWYPWGSNVNGNRPGDLAAAWRHVHDVFAREKVDNVIWLWSPNVLRGTTADLAPLYPGDDYVDWVGMDAYGFGEATASEVLDPTYAALRKITSRPVIIAETGAKPGTGKPAWIADLFQWMKAHPQMLGFVWFEHSVAQGGKFDYRFAADPGARAAFRSGIATLPLRPWPAAPQP